MSQNGLQSFLISEFKTGLFNYLEPWISPKDCFVSMENAYTYRGFVRKREGYSYFGRMAYEDLLTVGNGGKTYSSTLTYHPIVAGSFSATNGVESFTDNGHGVLTGSATGTGTINYSTGLWSLSFNANVGTTVNIYGGYSPNLSSPQPIMGITTWTNETSDIPSLIVCDTKRASIYNIGTQEFDPINSVTQIIYIEDGTNLTPSVFTGWIALAPYTSGLAPFSISITDGTDTIVDDGMGNLSASGNFAAGGTVNYTTGQIGLVFTASTAGTVITMTATLTGDYFTGNTSNFFNFTNWMNYEYLTNNKDQITLFTMVSAIPTLSRPPFSIDKPDQIAFVNNIASCLDVDVYKNRLLVQRPTIVNTGTALDGFDPQSIRWSSQFMGSQQFPTQAATAQYPTNFVAEIPGNGGELSAPTDDFMQSTEFLRDTLIVPFTNGAFTFRYTGSQFDPFAWNKINNTKSVNAPYGSVPYDERITFMGSKGLVACDGVNMQRYDISIIDEFLDNINQKYFAQCFGQRFDNTNQSWMLYPSLQSAGLSDSALIYNFLENSWTQYSFNYIVGTTTQVGMSCLGTYYVTKDVTWNDFAVGTPLGTEYPNWESADIPWNNFLEQANSPSLLGGGIDGIVYLMYSGDSDRESVPDPVNFGPGNFLPTIPIDSFIQTIRMNPFIGNGQKVQFAYIDFYYEINSQTTLSLDFSLSNSLGAQFSRSMTLDGPNSADTAMKRVYINSWGEFLQLTISNSQGSSFKILGMVLWAKAAGRLTP